MTYSTFVDYLRAACTSALLASQANAQTRGAVAFAPGGTTCTSRVARPFGTLPGETPHGWGSLDVAPNDFRGNSIVCPPRPLESSQTSAGDSDGPALAFGPSNVLAPPIISFGGKGRQPKGANHGHNANRKAPDVGGRAVRRLK
jgi:hypothetical protein